METPFMENAAIDDMYGFRFHTNWYDTKYECIH